MSNYRISKWIVQHLVWVVLLGSGFSLLHGCALGALSESDVSVQPVLKPGLEQERSGPPVEERQPMQPARPIPLNDEPQAMHWRSQPDSIQMRVVDIDSALLTYDVQPQVLGMQLANADALGGDSSNGPTYLQVGMFASRGGAEQVQANVRQATDANVSIDVSVPGEYRVLVGPISPAELSRVREQLSAAGLSFFRYRGR